MYIQTEECVWIHGGEYVKSLRVRKTSNKKNISTKHLKKFRNSRLLKDIKGDGSEIKHS